MHFAEPMLFFDREINFLRFLFLGLCTCFVDLASIGWGGTSLLYALILGWVFLCLGNCFQPVDVSLDLAQGGGCLDIELRCMQEFVDPGGVPILKQHKHKKRWKGLGMKRNGWRKLRCSLAGRRV